VPLEISEIGVRMSVQDAAGGGTSGPAGPTRTETTHSAALAPEQMRELVTQCVREVLGTLRMLGAR
jgi:hypothetical protein